MKKIMLITFLLFAVLTISAVSAADDIASDNITVSDDADIIAIDDEDPYEDYELSVEEYESICIDPENEDDEYDDEAYIAYIDMPLDAKGSLQIWNDKEALVQCDFDKYDTDHWKIDDEDDECIYGYILLKDLDLTKIKNNDILYLKYFEEGKSIPVDSLTVVFKVIFTENGFMKLTEIDDEYEFDDVEVDYAVDFDEGILMDDDWNETTLIAITVYNEDLEGRVEVWLNKTLAFNKDLDELDVNSEDDYVIYIKDLNINQAGTYLIDCYVYDDSGVVKYNSTEVEEDQPILRLYESQSSEIDDVTITVNPLPTTITGNESFITVNSSASKDDTITIYIDDEEPVTVKLNDARRDEDDNYIIGSKELNMNLTVGEHTINITYKGKNITNQKINLKSNIVINFEEDTVYTGFDDEGFIFITLDDDEREIESTQIEGKINVTIIDDNGNTIDTKEWYLDDLDNAEDVDEDARIIKTDDINSTLNGTYTVIVRYFDGDEAATQIEGKVTFITLTAEDFGTSINTTIKDVNDSVITFKNLPLIDNIIIEIDGKQVDSSLYSDDLYDQEEEYYLKPTQLGLTEGTHTISVYLEKNNELIELASGEVYVDVEENFDPNLTITVKNIVEGNAATVMITTNETFTGNVAVQVANTNYTVKVTNGKGNISITGLKANTYTATALFKTDGIFNDSTKTTKFTVAKKIDPNLTIAVANVEEGSVATVVITTNETFTGDVAVQVANTNYTVKVINGKGNISITGLKANTYTATALFKSSGIFNDSTKNTTFTVTSKATQPVKKPNVIKLTLKKVKVKKSAKKLVLKATLKINGKAPKKGTKIKFTFKGKKYIGKTNKKGVAKVTIKKKVLKKLKVGKKVKYAAKYGKKTVKKTVKVKK